MKKILPNKAYSPSKSQALDLWVKLARSFAVFNKGAVNHIRSTGLTPSQFAVVECLGHKGGMTLGELSQKMLMSCGNITVVVDNLEKEGLVERLRCENDRRVVYVNLTASGQQHFDAIFPEHADRIEALASVLSDSEQKQLAGLLKKLGLGLGEESQANS